MKDIKPIVAENLASLRKNRGLTQAELAEKFDYSDKAISRWERGDTMPDINVLCDLCEFYGVTLDYLVHKGDELPAEQTSPRRNLANRIVMSALIISIIWLVATVVFAYIHTFKNFGYWQIFVWAVPASCIAAILSSRSWLPRVAQTCIWSGFIWTFLAGVYLQLLKYNFWLIFIIGIPAQVIIVLWHNFKNTK